MFVSSRFSTSAQNTPSVRVSKLWSQLLLPIFEPKLCACDSIHLPIVVIKRRTVCISILVSPPYFLLNYKYVSSLSLYFCSPTLLLCARPAAVLHFRAIYTSDFQLLYCMCSFDCYFYEFKMTPALKLCSLVLVNHDYIIVIWGLFPSSVPLCSNLITSIQVFIAERNPKNPLIRDYSP